MTKKKTRDTAHNEIHAPLTVSEEAAALPQTNPARIEDAQGGGDLIDGPAVIPPAAPPPVPDGDVDNSARPFKVLGYNNGVYFYFPRRKKQIVALTASQHTMMNFFQLAPRTWWEETYGKNPKKWTMLAADALIDEAQAKGVFIQEGSLRGAGCWIDAKRVVLHCGNKLYVNNDEKSLDEFESEFVYTAAARLIEKPAAALDNAEAAKFRKLCEAPTWENDLSGSLLAGWCVIAPVCAALKFRPHIYITGESDSGKSWVVENIVKPAVGRMALCVDGGTTEPQIRALMGYDGRPLVFDEAQGQHGREIMVGVIELARKATDGKIVSKFGQRPFKAQFCGAFSAVHPPVNRVEDENRFAFLRLLKNKATDAIQHFDDIQKMAEETIGEDFAERLLARTIANFNTLQNNIKVFSRAARVVLNMPRSSQVVGAMLAGLYLLGRTKEITQPDAEAWIKKHNWEDYTPLREDNEPMRLLQHVCASLVRYSTNQGDLSIGDMIGSVIDSEDSTANRILRQHAIKVTGQGVTFGDSSPNLAKLLRDTDWNTKWNRMLSAMPGAVKMKNDYFMRGVKMNGVRLPLELFKAESRAAKPQGELTL